MAVDNSKKRPPSSRPRGGRALPRLTSAEKWTDMTFRGHPLLSSAMPTPQRCASVCAIAVTDLAAAAALGRPSTGHAHIAREQVPVPTASNIVMSGGTHSEEELIAQLERGVYLQRFWYTRLVNRITGTITGVTRDACFLIEDGRLTTPLNGMRFTESVLGVLAGIEAIGADVRSQPIPNVWNGSPAPAYAASARRVDHGERG